MCEGAGLPSVSPSRCLGGACKVCARVPSDRSPDTDAGMPMPSVALTMQISRIKMSGSGSEVTKLCRPGRMHHSRRATLVYGIEGIGTTYWRGSDACVVLPRALVPARHRASQPRRRQFQQCTVFQRTTRSRPSGNALFPFCSLAALLRCHQFLTCQGYPWSNSVDRRRRRAGEKPKSEGLSHMQDATGV